MHDGHVEGVLHDHAGGKTKHVLGIDDSGEGVKKSVENSEDGREKSNFFGLNYLLWFEFGIEGKIMRKRIYKYLSILPTFIL